MYLHIHHIFLYILYLFLKYRLEFDYLEYDKNGQLEYEGEYLNGERHGKGKEYYHNGQLEYEGEYLNGKRHGKGKEYYCHNGQLEFEIEYVNGKRLW